MRATFSRSLVAPLDAATLAQRARGGRSAGRRSARGAARAGRRARRDSHGRRTRRALCRPVVRSHGPVRRRRSRGRRSVSRAPRAALRLRRRATNAVELATVRVTAHREPAGRRRTRRSAPRRGRRCSGGARIGTRDAWDGGAVRRRDDLRARTARCRHARSPGPAIVEQYDTTTWLPAGWQRDDRRRRQPRRWRHADDRRRSIRSPRRSSSRGSRTRAKRWGSRCATRRTRRTSRSGSTTRARSSTRDLQTDRAGRAHPGAPRIAAVGLAPHARAHRRRRRGDAARRSVGRERSVPFGHAPQRRDRDPADLRRRRDRSRYAAQQGASRRRRRDGAGLDAAQRARTLRRRLHHAADAADARRRGRARNGRRSSAPTRARPRRAAATCARSSPATSPASVACANWSSATAPRPSPQATAKALDDGERRMRAALRAFPDGVAERRGRDGRRDAASRRSCCSCGSRSAANASCSTTRGTSPQLPMPLNAVYGVTLSGVYYAIRALLAPDVPMNDGVFRPVEVHVPEGTLLNPRRPAPVSAGNVETSMRNADLVLAALGAARARARPRAERRLDEQRDDGRDRRTRRALGVLRNERLRDGRASAGRRRRRDPSAHDEHAQHADRGARAHVSAARRRATSSPTGRRARAAIAAARASSARCRCAAGRATISLLGERHAVRPHGAPAAATARPGGTR